MLSSKPVFQISAGLLLFSFLIVYQNCGPAKLSSDDAPAATTGSLTPVPVETEPVTPAPETKDPRILISGCTASAERDESVCESAFDGITTTMWSAGTYVGWIELDLGKVQPVAKMFLTVAQSPNGNTVHNVYYGTPENPVTLLKTFSQFTQDGMVLSWEGSPVQAQYIRIETTSNPSWTAWTEIELHSF